MISSAAFASTAASSAIGIGRVAGQPGLALGAVTGRYASALQLLSINTIWSPSGSGSGGLLSGGQGTGGSNPGAIAATYAEQLEEAGSSFPGSSRANQRHIAQFNTIMEHRTDFPPGEFYIHTELGDGASITTRVPAVGETNEPAKPSRISLTVTAIMASVQTASASVTATAVQAAYAEWS